MDINFIAPVCQTGYGVVGLNLLAALGQAGHKVALYPIGPVAAPQKFDAVVRMALQNRATSNLSAPSVCLKEITLPVEPIGQGLQSLYTIFELDGFTRAELEILRSTSRLLVCTRWARDVLLPNDLSPESIRVVPLGVDNTVFSPTLCSDLPASPDTIFMNVGKFELRKGHDVLIEAFNLAFEPKDRVRLAVHGCNNMSGENFNRFWIDYCKGTRLGDKITVVETPFASQEEVGRFMARADCGVFPARAEGWNLELLEMMALGKTVIATDYAGHTEFANRENCLLINISELEDAQDGVKFTGQGRWARLGPEQIEQLVVHLRAVHQRKQSGNLSPNRAGVMTAQRFSWKHSADQLVANLV